MGKGVKQIANAFAAADEGIRSRFASMVENISRSRERLLTKVFGDTRRDVNAEAGYPEVAGYDDYRDLFEREPIASRVVGIFPKECWKNPPYVFEDEDPEVETEFEKALTELTKSLSGETWNQNADGLGSPIFEALQRVDLLSGIGSYGILLLGLSDSDDLSKPVPGIDETGKSTKADRKLTQNILSQEYQRQYTMGTDAQYGPPYFGGESAPAGRSSSGPVKLLYLKAFDEGLARIVEFEENQSNPRCGLPKSYELTIHDPRLMAEGAAGLNNNTIRVHWSRVIHVADNRMSSDVYGVPRMQPVLNRLLDLRKLYAGSAEMYWKGAFPGYSLETNPQISPADIDLDEAGLKDKMEEYMNGLQRYFWTTGMTAKSLAPQVVDPTQQIERQIDAICIQLGVPKRKFIGSERGELSSSDDESDWQKKVQGRKRSYLMTHVVAPFFDRLIAIGVLPTPKLYKIEWPDTDILTAKEQVELAEATTRTLALYVSQNVESIIAKRDYLTTVHKYTPEQADRFLDNAEEAEQENIEQEQKLMEEQQKMMAKAGGVPFSQGMPRPGKAVADAGKASTKPKTGPKGRRPMDKQPVKGEQK
jgi:hypothetical protein